ncbi:MAG TPA: SagB/ThcOx family dehydrogenase [Candidatus Bathyarchaeia archaeon]|nr:SagB/ThcOx family dehydrogenase [Candidatus Bathyarchaeia archaeon]
MRTDVGDDFQRDTKHSRERLVAGDLDWSSRPAKYKDYPGKRSIKLSLEFPEQTLPLVETLKRRRSVRSFSARPLLMNELSFLLWASTGNERKERGHEFRTVPSAGALYPIETYLVINNVEGLEKGLYHYSVSDHALEELLLAELGEEAAHAALEQDMCAEAPVVFIWTSLFQRSKWKYGQRAYRYVYLDVGHIAQNLALCATSVGLGTCQIGAFFDEEINRILDVDGVEESAIYLSVVGHPK